MQVSYTQCDLCGEKIIWNELNIKYKAKRNILQFFSVEDAKNKIPFTSEWKEIDVCENCLKEIIKRKQEKDEE